MRLLGGEHICVFHYEPAKGAAGLTYDAAECRSTRLLQVLAGLPGGTPILEASYRVAYEECSKLLLDDPDAFFSTHRLRGGS